MLDALASACALREVSLFGVPIDAALLRDFARANAGMRVGYDAMFDK